MRKGRKQTKKNKTGLLFVISGPSGSGKTTLAGRLLAEKEFKGLLHKSVSFTTRPKRSCERGKKDYHFVSQATFKRYLTAKKILEWTKYLGYYYGTPKDLVNDQLAQGKHLILCVDLRGAKRLKRLYPSCAVTIFIMPPSLAELEKRIEKRCSSVQKEEVLRRVELAKKEVLAKNTFDYVIVNKDFERSVQKLRKIVTEKIKLLH